MFAVILLVIFVKRISQLNFFSKPSSCAYSYLKGLMHAHMLNVRLNIYPEIPTLSKKWFVERPSS